MRIAENREVTSKVCIFLLLERSQFDTLQTLRLENVWTDYVSLLLVRGLVV
ncbi:MAG TPA: hypothetical protein V6C78_19205 [Crinalium sp.]